MGFLKSVEVPALDNACVTFTLAGTCNVDLVACLKCVYLNDVAYVVSVCVVKAELLENLLGCYIVLRVVTLFAFTSPKPSCTAA